MSDETTKKRRRRRRMTGWIVALSCLVALLTVGATVTLGAMQAAGGKAAGAPSWLAAVEANARAASPSGFAWLELQARGKTLRARGEAPTAADKEAALTAVEAAQIADPTGEAQKLVLTDLIAVAGGEAGLGAALEQLGETPGRVDCQAAFEQTLAGRVINFETGSAGISTTSARLLDALTAVALACEAYAIEVGGHTDRRGRPAANQALSQTRAESVRAYLMAKGVPPEQLTATGYGATRPIDPSFNAAADARNRRIEFTVRDPR